MGKREAGGGLGSGTERAAAKNRVYGVSGRDGFRGYAGYSSDDVCKRVGVAGIDLVFPQVVSGTAAQPKSREVKTGWLSMEEGPDLGALAERLGKGS